MQKLTFTDWIALLGELFHELSILHVAVLGWIVAIVAWFISSGASLVVGALPSWALAVSIGSLAVILFATIRIGHARLGWRAVGIFLVTLLSLGSTSYVTDVAGGPNPDTPIGSFLNLATVALMFSWLLFGASIVGAIVAGCAYVQWARNRPTCSPRFTGRRG